MPPEPPAATLAAERAAHRAAVAVRPHGGGRSVLVVDGSAIARKFLLQRLESLGYRAHAAESAERAMEMIANESFAIVFSEVALADGGLDGLALCRQIKQSTGAAAPAVVIATGQGSASDRVRATLAGCDAYLIKPLAAAPFAAVLAQVDPGLR